MRGVVALGGNALLKRGEPLTAEAQSQNIKTAATALAPLIKQHSLVITHGNGPQVGLLALQAEADKSVPPYLLDVLGAETEGMIGYLIERELKNRLPDTEMVTLLTQERWIRPIRPFKRPPSLSALPTKKLRRGSLQRSRDVRSHSMVLPTAA